MKFTCEIQKVDFFIDQTEEKGQVNLDQAIEIFQNFPFDEQLKEARERELTSCLPTVSFKSEDRKTLGIWAEDDKGFFIHYDNGNQFSDFFISNDFEQNPQGLAVEEFIELFFQENIESELCLINKVEETKPKNHAVNSNLIAFSFSDTKKIKFYLWTFPYLAFALFLFKVDAGNNFVIGWGIHLFFSIFYLPSTLLHLSYWLKNDGAIVTIDTKGKILAYEKNGQEVKFNRNDIYNCVITEPRSYKAPWNSYRYIWFVLKDKRQIVITNFITEPENIISSLKPNFKVERRTIPFLPL